MKQPSTLIMGCMGFGGWNKNPIGQEDRKRAFSAIEAALEQGINTFDHADIYTYGKAELLFGEFLKAHPSVRDQVFIQSKAGIVLTASNTKSNTYNNSLQYLQTQIESSLNKLNTDYLDCFLVHRYDPLVSPEELAKSLCSIKEQGLAKTIGISNMPPSICQSIESNCDFSLQSWQVQLSLGQSQLLQANTFYNLREDSMNTASLHEYFVSNNTEVQAWGALDKGTFLSEEAISTKNETALLLQKMAHEKGTSMEAVQLAWLLNLPFKVRPIIGSTRPERIAASARALQVNLSREEWYNLWISALGMSLP